MRQNTLYRNRMDRHLLLMNENQQVNVQNIRSVTEWSDPRYVEKLYANIVKIDYTQVWNSSLASFDCEQTFTWLDWNIAENIKNRTGLPFDDLM